MSNVKKKNQNTKNKTWLILFLISAIFLISLFTLKANCIFLFLLLICNKMAYIVPWWDCFIFAEFESITEDFSWVTFTRGGGNKSQSTSFIAVQNTSNRDTCMGTFLLCSKRWRSLSGFEPKHSLLWRLRQMESHSQIMVLQ